MSLGAITASATTDGHDCIERCRGDGGKDGHGSAVTRALLCGVTAKLRREHGGRLRAQAGWRPVKTGRVASVRAPTRSDDRLTRARRKSEQFA